MKKINAFILAVIALSIIVGIYFYPQMPERMASHWNSDGEVDGYMSKFWGLFLMPLVSLFMFMLFLLIPGIDPLKKNISKFRGYFDWFIGILVVFLFYIYVLTLVWNMGYSFNMTLMMVPAVAILFFYCGVLVENAKRNWFIGIRTPWTLSSDKVWDKTHKLGGKLFKIAAVVSLLGLLFQQYAIWFVLVPVLGVALYTIVYSYLEYRKIKK